MINSSNYNKLKKTSMETLDVTNESIPKKAMSISYARKASNLSNTKTNSTRSSNSSGLTHFDNDFSNNSRSQSYNDIEVEGENLFNSVSKASEIPSVKKANAHKRFSTEEAKRLSIISMQQLNLNDDNVNNPSTRSPSYDTPLPSNSLRPSTSTNNFKYASQYILDSPVSEKSLSSPLLSKDFDGPSDPSMIRRQMSLKRRSVAPDTSRSISSTGEVDPLAQLPTANVKSANAHGPSITITTSPMGNVSSHATPVSRRSSLLASGDVLFMKQGKLQRKSSTSSAAEPQPKLTRINDLRSVSSRCLESSPENEDIIPFTNSVFYKIKTNSNHSQSDLEMDPLDTRNISETKPSYQSKKKFADLNLNDNTRSNSKNMNNIIKSIAENTRDQLRRSTVISSTSQSSGNSYSGFVTKSSNQNSIQDGELPNLLGFSFVKGQEEPQKKINLDEAGYSDGNSLNTERFSDKKQKKNDKNKKKSDYNWLDMF